MPEEQNVYEAYTPPETQGQYHKFENGITYRLRLLSEPVAFESIFEDKKTGDTSVSTKFAWLVFDTEQKTVKIMQLPTKAYKQIAALGVDPEFGDPRKYDIKISRSGEAAATTYAITPGATKNSYAEVYPEAAIGLADADIIETLSKNDKNRNVAWVRDLIGKPHQKSELAPATTAADLVPTPQVDDKPIDLSEIPF